MVVAFIQYHDTMKKYDACESRIVYHIFYSLLAFIFFIELMCLLHRERNIFMENRPITQPPGTIIQPIQIPVQTTQQFQTTQTNQTTQPVQYGQISSETLNVGDQFVQNSPPNVGYELGEEIIMYKNRRYRKEELNDEKAVI